MAAPTPDGSRRRLISLLVAVAVVLLLVAVGAVAYASAVTATAAASGDFADDDAHAAAIRDAILARSDAYDVASDAREVVVSVGDLLTDAQRADSLSSVEALETHLGEGLPIATGVADVVSYTAGFRTLVEAVHSSLTDVRDTAVESASDRLAADTLASVDCRDAVIVAIAALKDVEPSVELLAALLGAVDAADESHADAAAAPGGAVPGGGAGGGGPGGSGGTGGTGGSGGSGPSTPPPPPPPPPYTDADAVAAVSGAYGGQLGTGTGICGKINYGTWGRTGTPPPPALIPDGAWMAFKAWSAGGGGAVQYYACH